MKKSFHANAQPPPTTVDVWQSSLDLPPEVTAYLQGFLNSPELQRGARLIDERVRSRWQTSRGLLRWILGRYTGISPREIEFTHDQPGKPYAIGIGLEFNISHSGDRFACAIAQFPVGIDLERHREIPAMQLVCRFFAASEIKEFCQLSDNDRLPHFFSLWTQKEAYLKALGTGLTLPLNAVELNLASPKIVGGVAGTENWTIRPILAPPGYSCALVAARSSIRLRHHTIHLHRRKLH
jgi:4'-phosphopantetheinyl transferase